VVLKVAKHLLAIAALLVGCVVGPETHVHPGEGPHSDPLVHAHAGIVGHTHSGQGLSKSGEGPATYINAFSLSLAQLVQLAAPSYVSEILYIFSTGITGERVSLEAPPSVHAPPGLDFGHLRAPPFVLPA
jgi:hypothetical protein